MESAISGTQLNGFTLVRLIARGGMGEVYEAVENKLQRRVALKVIAPNDPTEHDQDELVQRFLQEARTLARVNHPNVVTIYSIDSVGGVPFIAMEYIEGVSFRELLEEFTFSADGALPLFLQMLEGLKSLHEHRILHRDLKPHNILLRADGQVKILDFGIAKHQGGAGENEALTRVGIVVGTLPYMPPEVRTGVPASVQSDLWSLGAIFYECLTGERLIEAQKDAGDERDVPFTAEQRTRIPREVRALLRQMCAQRPTDRYANVAAVIEAVQAIQRSRPAVSAQIWANLARKVEELTESSRKQSSHQKLSLRIRELAELANAHTPTPKEPLIRESQSRSQLATPAPLETITMQRSSKPYRWFGLAIATAALIVGIHSYLTSDEGTSIPVLPSVPPSAKSPIAKSDPPLPLPAVSNASPSQSVLELREPVDKQNLWLEPTRIPTLVWSRLLQPGEYEVQLANNDQFQPLISHEPVSGASFRPAQVLGEGHYYWRLKPLSKTGSMVGPFHFTLSTLAPTELVKPNTDLVIDLTGPRSGQIEFVWSCKPGAKEYLIQFSGREDFSVLAKEVKVNSCSMRAEHLPAGEMFWRVRVNDVEVAKTYWSETRSIVLKTPPAPVLTQDRSTAPPVAAQIARPKFVELTEPKLINSRIGVTLSFAQVPRDIASIGKLAERPPVLEWKSVRGAKTYLLQISTVKDFSALMTEEAVSENRVEWRKLIPGRVYWRVAAMGASGERSNFSDRGTLDVFLPAPKIKEKFEISASEDGTNTGEIDWSPSPTADRYLVQISPRRDLAQAQEQLVSATKIPVDRPPGAYFVRVAAADANGTQISGFSSIAAVDVNLQSSLERPKTLSPSNGAHARTSGGRISIVFSWSKVGSADSYTVEMASDPEFKQILDRRNTKDRGLVLKQVELRGRIYWRVRASSAQGSSPWSQPSFFEVH